jgi:hypothetical protein
MKKYLILVGIGLLIGIYAVLVMPPTYEDPECIEHEITDDGPQCVERVYHEEPNEFRFPLAVGGGVITLIGGFLYASE